MAKGSGMNLRRTLQNKLEPQFKYIGAPVHQERLGHRTADWTKQIKVVVDDLQVV